MNKITPPTRDQVSPENQAIFDNLQNKLGMIPNLYATLALSENALTSYLALQNSKSTITGKAREVVNLVVSQANHCEYCLAAHTVIGKMAGFTDAQILEIRRGTISFDTKLNALAQLTRNIVIERGQADPMLLEAFFMAGWDQENLVDMIVTIGDKIITNYLHATTQVPVDFPMIENVSWGMAA